MGKPLEASFMQTRESGLSPRGSDICNRGVGNMFSFGV